MQIVVVGRAAQQYAATPCSIWLWTVRVSLLQSSPCGMLRKDSAHEQCQIRRVKWACVGGQTWVLCDGPESDFCRSPKTMQGKGVAIYMYHMGECFTLNHSKHS